MIPGSGLWADVPVVVIGSQFYTHQNLPRREKTGGEPCFYGNSSPAFNTSHSLLPRQVLPRMRHLLHPRIAILPRLGELHILSPGRRRITRRLTTPSHPAPR